jgi:hypothetical protein
MNHDDKVDIIIDELSDIRWILVVETIYTIKHYYNDPPERVDSTQLLHLTHSDRHPIAYCNKNITLEDEEHEFFEKTVLPDTFQYPQMNCPVCYEAFINRFHRIFPNLRNPIIFRRSLYGDKPI